MKCIKQNEKLTAGNIENMAVVRVSNEKAKQAVESGFYVYASKSEWKEKGRH